jgi:hypothetical protein
MSVHNAGQALFPLDKRWQLDRSVFTKGLSRQMVWLSGLLPYEQCEAVFAEIGEQWLSASSIWRQTQKQGQRLLAYVEYQREQVSVERIQFPDPKHDHHQRKGMSMDGGMVNIRDEGWRELKVGTIFDVELCLERNPQTHDLDEMAHGINVHYTAILGSKDEFRPALWALAVQHDLPTARNRSVVADGALWIWDVAEDVCPDGQQVVDWYHAVEHLHKAAIMLYPDDHDVHKRQRWFKTYKNHLYMGHIETIISVLHKRDAPQWATYFERHKRRMQYLEFREEGLPIGSGTVESGVKQFKQRLSGTGMRWHLDNANRMLIIRAAVLGNEFHTLWNAA